MNECPKYKREIFASKPSEVKQLWLNNDIETIVPSLSDDESSISFKQEAFTVDLQLTGNLRSEISDDFNLSNSDVSVAGCLKYCLYYQFHVLKAGDFVLDIIRSGYMLPFHHMPDSRHLKNNKSEIKHTLVIEEAIAKLLKDKCIDEVILNLTVLILSQLQKVRNWGLFQTWDTLTSTLLFLYLNTKIWNPYLKFLSKVTISLLGIASKVTTTLAFS